ncbi:MAG TPA: hypothetical protein VFL42_00685, partial [Terriglobales bacterium]|nr:hypothetical protein [Terriglobales bacterium]
EESQGARAGRGTGSGEVRFICGSYATLACGLIFFIFPLIFLPTLANSNEACKFIQNSGDMLKNLPNRMAMSALMPVFFRIMSLTRCALTPIALANA